MMGAWPKSMPVEAYFLKYAFPCAFITLQRGRISESEFAMLEKAAVNGEAVERGELERIFAPAMRRLKKLAEETGHEMWSRALVEEYYFKNHNQIIDEGEGDYGKAPEVLKELCKIFPAVVVGEQSEQNSLVQSKAHTSVLQGGVQKEAHTSVLQGGVQKEAHTSKELRAFEVETNNVGGGSAFEVETNNVGGGSAFEVETNNAGVVVELPGGKLRAVNTGLTGALKKGDRVMVHYGYACEKLV